MSIELGASIEDCFGDLPDPRVRGRCDHKLLDIIMITICGVLCGADSWVGIKTVGKAKEKWFREFLDLAHGIPSHDTFGYVIATNGLDETRLSTPEMLSTYKSQSTSVEGGFQMMEGVDVLIVERGSVRQRLILNLCMI